MCCLPQGQRDRSEWRKGAQHPPLHQTGPQTTLTPMTSLTICDILDLWVSFICGVIQQERSDFSATVRMLDEVSPCSDWGINMQYICNITVREKRDKNFVVVCWWMFGSNIINWYILTYILYILSFSCIVTHLVY